MRTEEAQARKREARSEGESQKRSRAALGAEGRTATAERTKAQVLPLMEAVVERGNLWTAYRKVVANKGAPGVDGITVAEFKDWLKEHWPTVRAALLAGRYLPQAVRAVEIPKSSGKGSRVLGIPTLVDRLIQQAVLQILQPIFEPGFSESSYGFRPGRSAHQAVKTAQRYLQAGKRIVVDVDLEKFFDRINHDILMSRVARQVKDVRVLKLIRRYLEAGLMQNGVVQPRGQGSPQGGPLSPLLSNILLTDLDRELERRGHSFCRYADDCNVYVSSWAAAEHAMQEFTQFLQQRLKLQVNRDKSACARPWQRKFLGYSFTHHKQAKLKVAPESLKRLQAKVRECLSVGRGRTLWVTIGKLALLLRGWMSYFRLTEVKGILQTLDRWIRRKLRCLLWRQWKHWSGRFKALVKLGVGRFYARQLARNRRGPWRNSRSPHMQEACPNSYFDRMGLISLVTTHQQSQVLS
jgi:RNA-directed DNA polymerase